MTEEKFVTERTTIIHFKKRQDLVNFLAEYGLKAREEKQEVNEYVGDIKITWGETRRVLQFLHIEPRQQVDYFTVFRECEMEREIPELFKLNGTVDMWSEWAIHVRTKNLMKIEHKREVQKIYLPLIEKGYQVTYNCETETKNETCLS